MSFSKARIQRFNELTSEAPPPGSYDPKFDIKVKGSVIREKTGRFHDAKSTTSSNTDNASVSSRSTHTVPIIKPFRTPQIPKKRVVAKPTGMSCPRVKTKLYKENKDPFALYEPKQEVADLKVECSNKDKTIQEYEKLIDDMKSENKELSGKLDVLQKKHTHAEDQHQKDIESMARLQQEVMNKKNEKYQAEIETLRSELSSALKINREKIEEKTRIEDELKAKINSLEDELSRIKKQDVVVDRVEELEILTKNLDALTGELSEALNEKDSELSNLLKLQTVTEQKLDSVQNELEKAEKQVSELKANIELINQNNAAQILCINSQLMEQILSALQEYFDYDNCDGKRNAEKITFHPDVEEFLKKIRKFSTDLKSAFEREMELSRDNFNEERENLEQELEKQKKSVIELQEKLKESGETNTFLTEELEDVQKLYKELSSEMKEVKTKLEAANDRYDKAVAAHQAELDTKNMKHSEETTYLYGLLDKAKNEYLMELDYVHQMEKKLEEEKKRMKECADRMIGNAEAVTRETLQACRAESEEKVRKIITETDSRVNSMVRDAVQASEDKLRQVCEKYEARLGNLEKEKAALNTEVSKKDLEIAQMVATLDEVKCTAETQESFSQSLQAELDRAEAELVEKKEELRTLKDQLRNESAEMVARRRRLEVVMSENQASLGALAERLAESETEVERLQHELQAKENDLLGYRELFETITQNSKMVQDQLDCITDKIGDRVEFINQVETQNVNEINSAKNLFNSKIDNLRSMAIQELAKAQMECQEKSERNAELSASLHQMSDRLNEATDMLLRMEEINDEQLIEISKLQLQNAKLKQQMIEKNQAITDNTLFYENQLEQYKTEMNEMNDELTRLKEDMKRLEDKKSEIEEKKYDFEELKFKYDEELDTLTKNLKEEKAAREKLEKQIKEHEEFRKRLGVESKHATEKCIEVMDRQRAKQVFQLKDKINIQQIDLLRLRQELDTKTDLLDELRQTNELLKVEARRQLGIGKENLTSSPLSKTLFPKSANATPVCSPHKPHTPLRDRNE